MVINTGQAPKNERMLFVVDSVAILNDPESWNPISRKDWADINVIRNKDSISLLGWDNVDAITYIFTKGYRSRPDSIRGIPSLSHMEMKDGAWYLHGRPYTGKYIDYYNSGSILHEGMLSEGKPNGTLIVYYQNGHKKSLFHYKDGILHGIWNDYNASGVLMQSREYIEGRGPEARKEYFINGRLQYERKLSNQTPYDTAIAYYSTGKVKKVTLFRNGVAIRDKKTDDLSYYTKSFYRSLKTGDLKEANQSYFKIWKIDSTSADTYYKGGLLMMKEFRFDEALAQLNEALAIEPLMMEAFVNRALVRIKKYRFAQVKPPARNFKEPVLELEDFMALPYHEQLKACDDLQQAMSLEFGDIYTNQVIPRSILEHCQKTTSF